MKRVAERKDAADIRRSIRAGDWTGPTTAIGYGWVQANVVIVPARVAPAFARFCRENARACPVLDVTDPGDPHPRGAAASADLRTDLPRYHVYREGELVDTPTSIASHWRPDLVSFLLGCSFTFEHALVEAGIRLKHVEKRANVAMFRTGIGCIPADPFEGNLVVSMRPIERDRVEDVFAICSHFPSAHGAPLACGDPAALGIRDVSHPDFGDAVAVAEDEEPVFWACGVTAEVAAAAAQLDLFITHAPGQMLVTDSPCVLPHELA